MTDPKQRKQLDRLHEQVIVEFTLMCANSKNDVLHEQTIIGGDEVDALDWFYENGWRVIRGKVYCPDCVEAKKK